MMDITMNLLTPFLTSTSVPFVSMSFLNAHLLSCCGQHCCCSCISKHRQEQNQQQKTPTCPCCREENYMNVINRAAIREVKELKIHCTNHNEGCEWVGELGGLKSHLDSDKGCGYVEVTCTNDGCGERVMRKNLQTHLQEKCDSLDCPNRCGVTGIRRRAMPDHRSSCPLEPLDCPFKDAGCIEKIARKDMEDHMTTDQQKHMLLTFQSLQQLQKEREQDKWELQQLQKAQEQDKWKLQQLQKAREQDKWKLQQLQKARKQDKWELLEEREQDKWELQVLKNSIGKEIDTLRENKSGCDKSLSHMKAILQGTLEGTLDTIGDTLTFRVRDFSRLWEEKKAWHSRPFIIGDKVGVYLAVYPSGVGRGQGSHVSVSLILMGVVKKEVNMYLAYNVSVTARGQHRPAAHKILELCTFRYALGYGLPLQLPQPLPPCSVYFPFPSSGEVLRSEELFLKIGEANSLLQNDAMILELKLQEHQHHFYNSFFVTT